jgi:hypothetical protein
VPIGGTNFEGQVVRYGIGASYDVVQTSVWRLAPVVELVGWTVLNGKELNVSPVNNMVFSTDEAGGNTIVNAKLGLRWSTDHLSIYAGYGRALTGAVWYKDMLRVELKLMY